MLMFDKVFDNDFAWFAGKALSIVDPGAAYTPNWHIDLIAEYLEAARRGDITRLIINMPPRSLKSLCVSVAWPAWLMGHEPHSRILAASYASRLSLKHSQDCRLLINSPWYRSLFPGTVLCSGQNEKHKFVTTRMGYRLASSVGASTIGEGGNFLIVDDPVSPAQAANKHWRVHVNRWFDQTFSTRLDDKHKGVIVLVMQRLHEHDLSGYLLAKGGWEHLALPACTTQRTLYGFGRVYKQCATGELLHSKREDAGLIERAKIDLGSAAFAAQYQQRPVPEEGGMLRPWWFKRYDDAPLVYEGVVQSWDTAIKNGAQHDASVCMTFIEAQGQSYLMDVAVMRYEYPDLKRAFYAMAERWEPKAILIEDRASGQQLLQDARRETALPLIAMQPKNDKVTRFTGVSAMIEAGRIVLPQQAPWMADFESELYAFPAGAHDDQVDALTQYLDWLRRQSRDKLRVRKI
jgi:predicted phage terminase large subunit-like protein